MENVITPLSVYMHNMEFGTFLSPTLRRCGHRISCVRDSSNEDEYLVIAGGSLVGCTRDKILSDVTAFRLPSVQMRYKKSAWTRLVGKAFDVRLEIFPRGLTFHSQVVANSRIFFFDGLLPDKSVNRRNFSLEILDGNSVWKVLPVGCIFDVCGRCPVVCKNEIMLFGGYDPISKTTSDGFEVFDTVNNLNREVTKQDIWPCSRTQYAAVASEDEIFLYIHGGVDTNMNVLGDLWEWNREKNEWNNLGDWLPPRFGHSMSRTKNATRIGNQCVFVLSGGWEMKPHSRVTSPSQDITVFQISGKVVMSTLRMNNPRANHAAAVIPYEKKEKKKEEVITKLGEVMLLGGGRSGHLELSESLTVTDVSRAIISEKRKKADSSTKKQILQGISSTTATRVHLNVPEKIDTWEKVKFSFRKEGESSSWIPVFPDVRSVKAKKSSTMLKYSFEPSTSYVIRDATGHEIHFSTKDASVPAAVESHRLHHEKDNSKKLTWTAPTEDGGHNIKSYEIFEVPEHLKSANTVDREAGANFVATVLNPRYIIPFGEKWKTEGGNKNIEVRFFFVKAKNDLGTSKRSHLIRVPAHPRVVNRKRPREDGDTSQPTAAESEAKQEEEEPVGYVPEGDSFSDDLPDIIDTSDQFLQPPEKTLKTI